MGRGTKAIKSQLFAIAGDHQRAPANQTGAEQGGKRRVAADLTEREREARISDRRRRVTAIARESREYRMIAQIFPMHHAIGTDAASVAEPRNADTLADAQALDPGADRVNSAYDLMARDNRNVRIGQFAVDDMKVGTANTTGPHLNPYLARPGLPIG